MIDPKFFILINGNISEWIEAKMALGRVSHSLYFFILYSQLLSKAFSQKRNFMGINVARNASKISHLMYADDILMFFEAKFKYVKKIKRIICNYYLWMGQVVNTDKSNIIFGNSFK